MEDVESKYAEKKQFLIRGYERAKFEEEVHYRQKDLRKYERMFENYAYPINATFFEEADKANVISFVNDDSSDIAVSKVWKSWAI